MVAFSSDSDVLQSQIYTLGLLVEEQVNRIVKYAAGNGRRNFALLVPDNSTGIAVAKAAVGAAAAHGARVVRIAFIRPLPPIFPTLSANRPIMTVAPPGSINRKTN